MPEENELPKDLKGCPIDNTIKIIGRRYTVLIIRNMLGGQKRFNEFLNSIEGISTKTLSSRLKEMEDKGLIQKDVYNETPVRIEYSLTKKGQDLKTILDQFAAFTMKNYPENVFHDGKSRTFIEIFGNKPAPPLE